MDLGDSGGGRRGPGRRDTDCPFGGGVLPAMIEHMKGGSCVKEKDGEIRGLDQTRCTQDPVIPCASCLKSTWEGNRTGQNFGYTVLSLEHKTNG